MAQLVDPDLIRSDLSLRDQSPVGLTESVLSDRRMRRDQDKGKPAVLSWNAAYPVRQAHAQCSSALRVGTRPVLRTGTEPEPTPGPPGPVCNEVRYGLREWDRVESERVGSGSGSVKAGQSRTLT